MTVVKGELAWGVTIEEASTPGDGTQEWTVELGSESLGSLAADATLTRFADDVSRLVPGAVPACSLTLGRFGMTLTITAAGPEEAADEGARVFRRVLEAAVWPRSIPASFAPCDVAVRPAAGPPAG